MALPRRDDELALAGEDAPLDEAEPARVPLAGLVFAPPLADGESNGSFAALAIASTEQQAIRAIKLRMDIQK
jgi:hypothetical protein